MIFPPRGKQRFVTIIYHEYTMGSVGSKPKGNEKMYFVFFLKKKIFYISNNMSKGRMRF